MKDLRVKKVTWDSPVPLVRAGLSGCADRSGLQDQWVIQVRKEIKVVQVRQEVSETRVNVDLRDPQDQSEWSVRLVLKDFQEVQASQDPKEPVVNRVRWAPEEKKVFAVWSASPERTDQWERTVKWVIKATLGHRA